MDSISKKALVTLGQNLLEEDKLNIDSEHEILDLIEYRVADLLDRTPDLLMSYMYRLDIAEHKIQTVFKFSGPQPIAKQLAQLIWTRQKERAKTKMENKPGNSNFWFKDEQS